MKPYYWIFYSIVIFWVLSCNSTAPQTDDELYDKTIISSNPDQPKIKSGDRVTFFYCLKNGDEVIASSDQSTEATVITIPKEEDLSKFERPLLWLGLGDSCVVHIKAQDATAELLSYKEHFKDGDQATFIYKIIKIN